MMASKHYQLLSGIYKKLFTTLYAHTQIYDNPNQSKLNYIKTFQSRFYPVRGNDFEHKSLYPFLFLNFVDQGAETLYAHPNMIQYNSTLGVVIMQYNDGDVNLQGEYYRNLEGENPSTLQQQIDALTAPKLTGEKFGYHETTDGFMEGDNTNNTKKGIIEIIEDVKSLIYSEHKLDSFGFENVNWVFSSVSDPTITSLQPLLLSPYIEAKQLNIEISIIEDKSHEQIA